MKTNGRAWFVAVLSVLVLQPCRQVGAQTDGTYAHLPVEGPMLVWVVTPNPDPAAEIKVHAVKRQIPAGVSEQTAGSFGQAAGDYGRAAGNTGKAPDQLGVSTSDLAQAASAANGPAPKPRSVRSIRSGNACGGICTQRFPGLICTSSRSSTPSWKTSWKREGRTRSRTC